MLFSPMNIGNVTIKNRIVMAPMLMGMGEISGNATKKMSDYYEERAKGGAGLIITEITRVDDWSGASSFSQLSMSHDSSIESFSEMVEKIHSHGTKVFVQLHHPGRQNMGVLIGTVKLSVLMDKITSQYEKLLFKIVPIGRKMMEKGMVPRVVSPSKSENSYFSNGKNRALRKSEIKKIISEFVEAARRVQLSGADGVQLHASHGYLIQQFLSPHTNKRTDEYGGSLENRMRFLLEIYQGIRKRCGKDFPIIVRLTVDECYDKIGRPGVGYSLEEGVKMAQILEKAGVDALDISSGSYDTFNYWLEPTSFECGWRKYMAAAVKEKVKIPVLAANLIRTPEQAEAQLQEGIQDFISLGRPTIADPHWGEKARTGRANEINRCICCLHCFESMQNNAYIGESGCCAINPFVGKESESLLQNGNGKTVAIIGAGPAGLKAAELSALRGFKTIVFEKENEVGGQLRLAAKPPLKEKINWCIEDLYNAAKRAGAEFRLSTEATPKVLEELNAYKIIVATGGSSFVPASIKGFDNENVFTADEILSGKVSLQNKKIALIGSGMTGLETAEMLAEQGNKVMVFEMAETAAPGAWMQHLDDILPRLNARGIKILTNHKLVEINSAGILLKRMDKNNLTEKFECDSVVISMGIKSERKLYNELSNRPENLILIGDAKCSGRIYDATSGAYEAIKSI